MVDKYGTEIVEGSLLVTKENTGPVPGRIWLGVAVAVPSDGGNLWFQSANLLVKLHASQSEDWQVVTLPLGCTFTFEYQDPSERVTAKSTNG